MKKIKKYSLVVMDICLVVIIISIVFKIIDNRIYSKGDLNRYFYENEYVTVFLEGRIFKRDAKKLVEILDDIPDKILQDFNEDGFEIVLTNANISEKYYNGDVTGIISGLFIESDRKIYISRKSNFINYATIHEIGHYFDFKSNWISESQEFQSIYEVEKEKLKTFSYDEHYKSNNKEYFATAFKEYLKNPKRLETYTPLTYKYISNLF